MMNNFAAVNALNSMIPISRFNKGEAGKIFEEVRQNGFRVVVKNNTPECVLISPKEYEDLFEKLEELEDFYLLAEAEERIKAGGRTYTQEEVMKEFGITEEDLKDVEVEIEGIDY